MAPYIILLVIMFLLLVFAQEAPIVKSVINRSRIDNYYLLRYEAEDDSDMKIFGAAKKGGDADEDEYEELEFHRKSGNLAKARSLGALLAQNLIDVENEPMPADIQIGEENRMQLRLLFAFAAYYSVEQELKNKILQHVTINVFYDALQKSVPEFYKNLGESGSFSFYYLCVRRGGDVDGCIGRTFAMLMNKEGDEQAEKLGKDLFYGFARSAGEKIGEFKFELPQAGNR